MTPRSNVPKIPLLDGSPQQIAAALREEIRRLEGVRPAMHDEAPVSAGCAAIDQLLPDGGLRRGWLTEWLGVEGGGAGTLALIAAREACLDGGAVVVMDQEQRFYPPAAAALGIDLETTIVVRPQSRQDELWTLDQALRCGGVAAVWAPLDSIDDRTFRRLQLAAEEGGALGLLVRPLKRRGRPSWSDVQFCIEPKVGSTRQGGSTARQLRVEVTRCRGRPAGGAVEVEFDDVTGALRGVGSYEEAHPLPVAPSLADSAAHRRPTTA
jgi:hypothetical protein